MKNLLKNKLALVLMAFIVGANQVSAEDSGGFIGFGLGVNLSNYQVKLSPCSLDVGCVFDVGSNMTFENSKKVGVSTSLIAGYKQMFNSYFGLRYYANFDYSNVNFNMSASNRTQDDTTTDQQHYESYTDKLSGYALSLGVNIDVLANFVATSKGSFGAFAGLNVGLRNWGGAITNYHTMHNFVDIENANQYWVEYAELSKKNLNFFDIGLNVGLRGNVLNHHDIELFAKIPFLQDTIIKSKSSPLDAAFIIKQDFILGLRYIYVF